MSRRREHSKTDELPELQSDADVDALMARLRTKIAPVPPTVAEPSIRQAVSGDAVRDLVAAQDGFASAVVRAMQVMAETLEELEADVHDTASRATAPVRARRRGRVRMPVPPRKGSGRKPR